MSELSLIVAFIAGLVSFISPCVLPIVPGFLAYLAGSSVAESQNKRGQIFMNSLMFVLGFSTVFAALGVLLNTVLESVAYDAQQWLSRIGGVIIIFFGLYLMGLIKIRFLEREHKLAVKKKFNSKYLTSFLFGSAFAAGWTPCVGAVLGAILGLAATQPGAAFSLLMSYALGLGIPFLVVGFFATPASQFLNRVARAAKWINIGFGVLLVILGILIFTGQLSRLANFQLLNQILLNL